MSKSRRPIVHTFAAVETRLVMAPAAPPGAVELAKSAGAPSGVRSAIETLEARKLLFALTVTDDPDGDGIGTATATFGYMVPFLFREIPDPTDADSVSEEFDDEQAPWTTQLPATPPPAPSSPNPASRSPTPQSNTQPVQRVAGPDAPPGPGYRFRLARQFSP